MKREFYPPSQEVTVVKSWRNGGYPVKLWRRWTRFADSARRARFGEVSPKTQQRSRQISRVAPPFTVRRTKAAELCRILLVAV